MADLILDSSYGYVPGSEKDFRAHLMSRLVCGVISIYFTVYECRQVFCQGLKKYLNSFWDWADVGVNFFYHVYIYVSYFLPKDIEWLTQDGYTVLMLTLKVLIVSATLVKLLFYLRIFDQLSFLIQMLHSVIMDLRYFLLFFAVFLSFSALLISVLFD